MKSRSKRSILCIGALAAASIGFAGPVSARETCEWQQVTTWECSPKTGECHIKEVTVEWICW